MTTQEAERLARVETQVEDMKTKVDEMHAAFLAARGAKWVIVALWIGLGAAIVNIKFFLGALGVKFS
jgi:hypothetical protein